MSVNREQVIRAAVLLLSRRPTASTDEIARAAGISRATLHRWYPGRAALLRELALRAVATADAAVDQAQVGQGPGGAALDRLVTALMPDAGFIGFLYGENSLVDDTELIEAWDRVIHRVEAVAQRGQQDGSLRVDLPAPWVADALFSLVAGAGWSVLDGRLAPRDAPHAVAALLFGGAARDAPSSS